MRWRAALRGSRSASLIRIVAAALFVAPAARASDSRDSAHGRFDGDLAVAAGLGGTFGPRAPRVTADVRLRYLSTAGLYGTYEDGPLVGASAEPRRVIGGGVELRPLFLARWAQGLETGRPRLDLFIDSLGLEIGAVFVQPEGARFGARPGLQAGLGLEVPFFPDATGLFLGLHGGVRWSDTALSGGPLIGPSDRAAYLTITIGWQQIFGAHVVDLGDRER